MIQINLLPYRAARRKENIRRQVSIYILSLILLCTLLFVVDYTIKRKIDSLNKKIAASKKELTVLKKKVKEVDVLKKKLQALDKKINIIESLKKGRKFSIDMLKEFTEVIVEDRMWLTKVDLNRSHVHFEGYALDDRTVADFMRNLESSSIIYNIDLKGITHESIKDIPLRRFVINAHTVQNEIK
jgi:type IV pilus assembly protein PilN